MPTVDLDAADLAMLRMLVSWRLSGLAMEIDHTDTREFKDMLRRQRDELERLAGKLGAA